MNLRFTSLILLLLLASCGAVKKKTTYSEERKVSVSGTPKTGERINSTNPDHPTFEEPKSTLPKATEKAESIINTALTFSGVRYKYGGTTEKGMDCSGLLYVAFGEHDVPLPRVSHQMAEEGKRIRVEQVDKGDLLFFTTGRRNHKINHVGLVVEVDGDDIKFIHSTTSRGVIVSSLKEGYWNYAFVKAARIL